MQRDTLSLLVLSLGLVTVGITGIILDFLSWKAYKGATDSLRAKRHRGIDSPEDVINLIIAEAKKIGMTPKRVVVGENSACVDFKEPDSSTEQSKE